MFDLSFSKHFAIPGVEKTPPNQNEDVSSSNVIGAKIHSTLDMVFVNCKHIFLGIYSTKVILVSVNEGQSHCCAVVYLSPAVWTFPHSTGIKRLHPALLGFQNLAFIVSLHNLHPFAVLLELQQQQHCTYMAPEKNKVQLLLTFESHSWLLRKREDHRG